MRLFVRRIPPLRVPLERVAPADGVVELRARAKKLPPAFFPTFIILILPVLLHPLAHDPVGLGVGAGALLGPVPEVDDPARGLLLGVGVEVLAVQIGEQHVPVARVLLDQGQGLLLGEEEALAEDDGSLECFALVRLEALGGPLLPVREERRNERGLHAPDAAGAFPPASVHVHAARDHRGVAGPGLVGVGRVDGGAPLEELLQAHLAGVALGDGVHGQKAEVPAFAEQPERPQEEVAHQVGGPALPPGQVLDQVVPVGASEPAGDLLAAHERRVPHDGVEPGVRPAEHLGELQGPVERPNPPQPLPGLLRERGVVALVGEQPFEQGIELRGRGALQGCGGQEVGPRPKLVHPFPGLLVQPLLGPHVGGRPHGEAFELEPQAPGLFHPAPDPVRQDGAVHGLVGRRAPDPPVGQVGGPAHPHQRVAAAKGVVEEREGLVLGQGHQPQGELGHLHGQGVCVHPVHAPLGHEPARPH